MRRVALARVALLALLSTLLVGCTYYPMVTDTGGIRIEPKYGRIVRAADGARCYFRLDNTSKYGDTLLGAESQIARRVRVLSPNGSPLVLDVPGDSHIDFVPGGLTVALFDLTEPLKTGDGVIVMLIFKKSGRIGVVSVVE